MRYAILIALFVVGAYAQNINIDPYATTSIEQLKAVYAHVDSLRINTVDSIFSNNSVWIDDTTTLWGRRRVSYDSDAVRHAEDFYLGVEQEIYFIAKHKYNYKLGDSILYTDKLGACYRDINGKHKYDLPLFLNFSDETPFVDRLEERPYRWELYQTDGKGKK